MKTLLARTAGFCMGVRRAVQVALDAAKQKGGRIYTFGPLIHNPQAVEMLTKRGVRAIDDVRSVSDGTVLIRAHGVTPAEKEEIARSGLGVCDATCPLVVRIQQIVRRYAEKGYTTVIVGDRGHAEVEGLLGYANGHGLVIERPEEVPVSLPERLCVVSQSTQDRGVFDEVVRRLRERCDDVKVFDTICDATTERQDEVRRLAKQVDAIVVVGGRNSANTRRLAGIAEELGVETYLVETAEELDPALLSRHKAVGLTAGASTPNWLIENVLQRLAQIRQSSGNPLRRALAGLADLIVKSDLYVGVGAGLLCYASLALERWFTGSTAPVWPPVLIAGLFVFAVHILNHFTDREYAHYKESYKVDFLERYRVALIPLGGVSAAAALGIAAFLGVWPFVILLVTTVLGLTYNYRLVPRSLSRWLRAERLRDVPASKNLGMALAWSVITVVVPLFEVDVRLSGAVATALAVVFLFTFTLVFTRSTLLDLRDVQSDMMVGHETIPIMLGRKAAKGLLVGVLALSMAGLVVAWAAGWLGPLALWMTVPVAYGFGYLYLYHRRVMSQGQACEVVADAAFYVAGATALIHSWTRAGL